MKFPDGGPIPGGPRIGQALEQRGACLALEDAVGAPDVGGVFADQNLFRAPAGPAESFDVLQGPGLTGDGNEEARRIGCGGGELVPGDDCGDLPGGLDDDQGVDAQFLGHGVPDAVGMLLPGFDGTVEHRIAAIEQRLHIRVPERFQQRAQVCHRDALGLAHIDAAKKRNESGHLEGNFSRPASGRVRALHSSGPRSWVVSGAVTGCPGVRSSGWILVQTIFR